MTETRDEGLVRFDPDEVYELWPVIPARLLEGLGRYFNQHIATGGFLKACLENNLTRAVLSADPESLAALPAIIAALNNEAPAEAWGTPMRVARWLELGKVFGPAGKLP